MLLAPTLAPSVLHSVRGEKEENRKKTRRAKRKERNTALEINHTVTRAFSAFSTFSGLSLFAINALAVTRLGKHRFPQIVSRVCFDRWFRGNSVIGIKRFKKIKRRMHTEKQKGNYTLENTRTKERDRRGLLSNNKS